MSQSKISLSVQHCKTKSFLKGLIIVNKEENACNEKYSYSYILNIENKLLVTEQQPFTHAPCSHSRITALFRNS
jgi:hypothetical protein